jgi:hypothetical protein
VGFDAIDASAWLVCNMFSLADEVALFMLEPEQPPKPNMVSTATVTSCFFSLSDFISSPRWMPKLINFVNKTLTPTQVKATERPLVMSAHVRKSAY